MKEINVSKITEVVEKMVVDANCNLPPDVELAIKGACENETSMLCKDALKDILENAKVAREKQMPICQDTGMAVFFVELGQDVHIVGGDYQEAFDKGVANGYVNGYLRKSTQTYEVGERVNRMDNTPAIVHTEIVTGDKMRITVCPKGFGSENMSNNAKKALIRETGKPSEDAMIASYEKELLDEINKLNIGTAGFKGSKTALAVHIISHPIHIAGMSVAVNINCHVARHKTIEL